MSDTPSSGTDDSAHVDSDNQSAHVDSDGQTSGAADPAPVGSDNQTPGAADSAPVDSEDQAELVALRKRNAELEEQLAHTPTKRGWRMPVALVLVILFGLALIPANQAGWLATTTLETDQFVATFAPMPEDPAVATAIGTSLAAQVYENAALEERISSTLPTDLKFLAAPIGTAVETLIAEASTRIISSEAFGSVWEATLRTTHSAAIAVVEGSQSGVVQAENGQVVLDLSELLAQVDQRLQERGIDVLSGQDIDGIIVLYEAEELGLVERIIKLIYAIRWAAPLAVLILLVGAILVASDKRKVSIWLGIGTIVAMLLSLVALRFLRSSALDGITDPVYQDGAAAAWDIVFDRLVAQTWGLLILGLVVSLVAWFFGPSARATSLRGSFVNARNESRGDAELTPITRFIQEYQRAIEGVAIGLGVIFLLLVPTVSGLVVIVVAAIVIAVVVAVEWLAGTGSPSAESEPEAPVDDKDSVDA